MGIEHTFLSSTFVLLDAFFRFNVEHTDPEEGLEKAETSTTKRYAHCPCYYCTISSIKNLDTDKHLAGTEMVRS